MTLLSPMSGNLGDPSMFAIGLTFWAWALTGSRGRGPVRFVGPNGMPSVMGYAALGALYGLILLIDPLTAAGAALGAVAFVTGRPQLLEGRGARTMITTLTTALLLAVVWPYFDIVTLIENGNAGPLTKDFAQPPHRPTYAWAAQHIRPGEVVLTDGHNAGQALAGYGPNLVAPVRQDPALDERERRGRLKDVRAFLSPDSTRVERTTIAHRYQVRWLLLTRRHTVPEEAVVVAWSQQTGEVLARVDPGVTR